MRIRTFIAETMEAAIAEIRTTMGPDAIIISTWESPRGRGVEVRAAIEDMNLPEEDGAGPSSSTLPIDDDLERRLRRELLGQMKSQISALSVDVMEGPSAAREGPAPPPDPQDYEVRPDGWVKTGIAGLLKTPLNKATPKSSDPVQSEGCRLLSS